MPATTLKFLLVGNCVLDQVFLLSRFPHEDEEMRALQRFHALGGNACNSAQILQQLGHDVHMMSTLGEDDAARWILKQLQAAKINTTLCQSIAQGSTPLSSIWMNRQNGSRTIAHHRDLPELDRQQLLRINAREFDWIHFEGRNVDNLAAVAPELCERGVPMSLEIEKQRDGIEQLIPFFNTIIVSSHYLHQAQLPAQRVLQDFRKLNPRAQLVCTLGDQGISAIDSSDDLITLEAEQVPRVVDTRGAGDCFIAALIDRLAQQDSFTTALECARKLAARKIQFMGINIQETL